MRSVVKFLRLFLKKHRLALLAALLIPLIFVLSLYLYELPLKAVLYPAALSLFIFIIMMTVAFLRERRRYEYLHSVESCLPHIPPLQNADSPVEAELSTLLALMKEQVTRLDTEWSGRYEDMNEYYSIWVHQIKTPIAAMKLTLENMDSPESRRLSRDLMRIERYVEMVLTYMRLESDSSDYVFKEYELDDIVRGAIRQFASEFIERRLTLNYEGVQMKVVTDKKWLSFIIEQLLSNALKYTAEGSISVFLEDGALCIKDTGIGISKEDLPRLFDNGFTGRNGRMESKSSGIGLYLCKRTADRLGHTLSLESEPDVGTTARIRLTRDDIGRFE